MCIHKSSAKYQNPFKASRYKAKEVNGEKRGRGNLISGWVDEWMNQTRLLFEFRFVVGEQTVKRSMTKANGKHKL